MFGFLKKKLSNVVESLTKKKEEKEKIEEIVEEKIENIEQDIIKEPEKAVEEIKEIVKEEPIEIKKIIEEDLKKAETVETKPEEKKSLFKKIVKKITEKKLSADDISPILNELGNGLTEGDVAYEVSEKIKNDLKKGLLETEVKRGEIKNVITQNLKNSLMDILDVKPVDIMENVKTKKPYIILFLGFNGSGKTTSISKLCKMILDNGKSCVIAAADTFRAGSIHQIEEHARRLGADVVKHDYGADPAAVAFDAISHATSKGIDFVLIDTAGRTHNNANLADEMRKIIRVSKPDLKVLVIDSLTGNDAVLQARVFNELGVDAIVFTKVDVNEKGGAILSVTHELKKPILLLCNGQEYENVIPFNAREFVDNLIGD